MEERPACDRVVPVSIPGLAFSFSSYRWFCLSAATNFAGLPQSLEYQVEASQRSLLQFDYKRIVRNNKRRSDKASQNAMMEVNIRT